MSDFDKEAEREKLREKYEHDQDEREATERMSDLLLKGATMTNAHCGTCGDPIFRYEGQEFCSTCQEVVAEADEEADDAEQADTADASATDGQSPADDATTGSTAAETVADTPADPSAEPDAEPPQHAGNGRVDARPNAADATADGPTDTRADHTGADTSPADWTTSIDPSVADAVETGGQSQPTPQATAPDPTPTGGDGQRPLTDARDSLTRTITQLTKQAEASDGLERTRAYLAAVEEAADALAALKRADR